MAVLATACSSQQETLVFLSTNDMHAKIQRFPMLATAVQQCRDTTDMVILTDAGDRWTGNAYVDLAEEIGAPMIELMNKLKFDVATLGNHEFDHGQAHLGKMIQRMNCDVVCANCLSDTSSFPQLDPYVIIERGDLKIGVVGAVTNYEGGDRPAGLKESFVGVRFPDPQETSAKYSKELKDKCDLVVLLSHMGDDRDQELLERKISDFDLVLSGHTHKLVDTVVNNVPLNQAYKDLHYLGVTKVTFNKKTKEVEHIEYSRVKMEDYAANPEFQAEVDKYYDNAELNKAVGEFSAKAEKIGLANWIAKSMAQKAKADIGVYHFGGVRLDGFEKGGISTAMIYDLEPFGTGVVKVKMTPEALRKMIIEKYNDTENRKESHRIDLFMTASYVLVTDVNDTARDVQFPTLTPHHKYTVALPDYVYKNYHAIEATDAEILKGVHVNQLLLEVLEKEKSITPDNAHLQRKVVTKLLID